MKKHFLKLLLTTIPLWAITAIPHICRGQNPILGDIIYPTPQTWSFMKYGNHQPNLYTGTVSVSIPIYTYKDSDFEIPISINYSSNGFLPNTPSGSLALGWFLNAGGCITREVRGIPDDDLMGKNYGSRMHYGFYHFSQNTPDGFSWFPLSTDNFDTDVLYQLFPYYYWLGNRRYETESDIYHFNFMGHQGRFCFGFNGEIHVYNTNHPHGEYRVDVSRQGSGFAFTITTGDGYKYFFSDGGIDRLDYSWRLSNSDIISDVRLTYVLENIEAPGGRTIEFTYEERDYVTYRPRLFKAGHTLSETPAVGGFLSPTFPETYEEVSNINGGLKSVTRTYLLTGIEERGNERPLQIEFEYESGSGLLYAFETTHENEVASGMERIKKLWKMRVKNKLTPTNDPVASYEFEYTPSAGTTNKVLFLTGVKMADGGYYRMEYHKQNNNFPKNGTTGIDHWGFYNNRNEHNMDQFIPDPEVNTTTYDETLKSTYRNPNADGAIMGMLKKLTYPTGGFSTFDYEPHDFSKKLTQNRSTEMIPELLPFAGADSLAGGLRIRRIADFSADGETANLREFVYRKPSGRSSGHLLHFPRYFKEFAKLGEDNNIISWVSLSASNLFAYSMDKTHIEYSDVTEVFSDGSSVHYHFSNYEEIPDSDTFRPGEVMQYHVFVAPLYAVMFDGELHSLSGQRGRLTQKCVSKYDETSRRTQPLSKEYFYYDVCDLDYTVGIKQGIGTFYTARNYIEDYPLKKVRKVDFFGADSLAVETVYSYNSAGQTTRQTVTDVPGETRHSYLHYLEDRGSSLTPIENAMKARGITRYPLRTATTLQRSGETEMLTGGARNTFNYATASSSSPVRPETTSSVVVESPVPYAGISSTDGYLETELAYEKYDAAGNLLQARNRNNTPVTYIWGYGGLYVVAKIENIQFTALAGISGLAGLQNAPLSGSLTEDQNEALRRLVGASVTSYEYKPMVGLTALTDPSGRRITYEYDSANRLEYIRGEDGYILEHYKYNYKK